MQSEVSHPKIHLLRMPVKSGFSKSIKRACSGVQSGLKFNGHETGLVQITRSVCFDSQSGIFLVAFNDQQILHGTYVVEKKASQFHQEMVFTMGFHNILVCP